MIELSNVMIGVYNKSFVINRFLRLTIIISILFLTSCSPKFYLKSNSKIETLGVSMRFNHRIPESDRKKIEIQFNSTLNIWNIESHKFTLNPIDSSLWGKADLSVSVDSIFLPPRWVEYDAIFMNTLIWFGAGYGIGKYNNPFFILLPIISFQPNDATFIRYKLSDRISDQTEQRMTNFISKTILLSNKEKERNRHIRNFGTQLYDFLEKFEKEYKKQNAL